MRTIMFSGAVIVFMIVFISATPLRAQLAWPMFHHDFRHTGLSPYACPYDPVKAWSYQVNLRESSPVVGVDARIFVGVGTVTDFNVCFDMKGETIAGALAYTIRKILFQETLLSPPFY